jgi:hypothetical protein
MFREASIDAAAASSSFWREIAPAVAAAPLTSSYANALAAAFAEEETGAVVHVYREIAQRIPRNAFTPHTSTLIERLR